jgi:hypothetical protein
MSESRSRLSWLAAGALLLGTPAGPYDIALFPTAKAPGARGEARLLPSDSPFGIGVTADGHASYRVRITAAGLPPPRSLGEFGGYVAWASTPDLTHWVRLGAVRNGTVTVGPVELNKFLLVISAEPDTARATHSSRGATVLHGTSPSGWLQSFLTHPLFRGIAQ